MCSHVFEGVDPIAGPTIPQTCDYAAAPIGTHAPIRDWWRGYANTPHPRDPLSPQRALILASEARMRARARRRKSE